MRGFGEIARLCEVGPADRRRGHRGRRGPHRAGRRRSTASPGPRASWSRRCPPTAWPCSTPTTRVCLAMARAHRGPGARRSAPTGGDVRADAICARRAGPARFTLATPWGRADVQLGVSGAHMAVNAAAAAAVALVLGVPLDEVAAGLARRRCRRGAWSCGRTPSGAWCSTTPTTPTRRRWTRRWRRWPRCRRAGGSPCSGRWPSSTTRRPPTVRSQLTPRRSGSSCSPVGTELYGVAPVDDLVARLGTLDGETAVLVKGSRVAGLERIAAALLAG